MLSDIQKYDSHDISNNGSGINRDNNFNLTNHSHDFCTFVDVLIVECKLTMYVPKESVANSGRHSPFAVSYLTFICII
jgi:hypothetical protein